MKKILVALAIVVLLLVAVKLLTSDVTVNAPFSQFLYQYTGKVPEDAAVVGRMRVPDGLQLQVWATGLPGVRMLEMTPQGHLLASLPRQGRVVAITTGPQGQALSVRDLLTDLDRPHGLALHGGYLYVAEGTRVVRAVMEERADGIALSGMPETVVSGLPDGGNHWTRSIGFGPDDRLYITAGSSCNVCEESEPMRAAMMVANADGSDFRVYASGLRNSVGFDWHPLTEVLYATDNGRDLLGDDFPPCELNRVVDGGFYGWPYANGANVPDPDFGAANADIIASARAPVFDFPAHTAPLGITFLTSLQAPPGYRNAALVALHGSWNRSKKSGYKVVSLHWPQDGRIQMRDFLTGFEVDEDVIGRPVDIAEGQDGSIYISDDFAGVIWRVSGAPGDSGTLLNQPLAASAAKTAAVVFAPEQVARGKALFASYGCGSCHLQQEADQGVVVKPLLELAERYDQLALVAFLSAPTPPMPQFPLSDTEREDLAAYLLSESTLQ
ncbi:PQQ-dependent sugar dehydrogenase [Pseudomaricurvus sp. HS19]|uniref:PQQ-dependent sugar dehydrogenase n=1 Tax=Pseudomaricurvus sp. HS19 TaxID=2692626 RepID=UPI001367D938|nr:PQQ-dependent sugar dehydrogenase [Pseudomaricurvus sp. HS19]MYM61968.1 hypothetical protein [Pseudomaricurvus sp. HS19]